MILKDCIKQAADYLFDNIPSFDQNRIKDLCYKALECLVIKEDSCLERLKPFFPSELDTLLRSSTDCFFEGMKNFCEIHLGFPFLTETNIDSLDNIKTNLTDISTEDLLYAISTNLTTINDNDSNKNNWLEIDVSASIVIGVASAVILLLIGGSSVCLWNKNRKIEAKKASLQEKEEVFEAVEHNLKEQRHENNTQEALLYKAKQDLWAQSCELNTEKRLLNIATERIQLKAGIEYDEEGYLVPLPQQPRYINSEYLDMQPKIHCATILLHHNTNAQEDLLPLSDNIHYAATTLYYPS